MSIEEDQVKRNDSYFTKRALEKLGFCGICFRLAWRDNRICGKCDRMVCEDCYDRLVYDKENVAGDIVCVSCIGGTYFEFAEKEDIDELIEKIEYNKYKN